MSSRPRLTAIITTFNEERNIAECVEALLWTGCVLVVDSFSTDRTVEIVKGYPAVRLLQHVYHGAAAQKNWAMDQTDSEWILIFDADERCTPALRDEIERVLDAPQHDAYVIRRDCLFLGKLIKHSGWANDRVLRLFRRGKARNENRRVHAQLVATGEPGALKHPMLHLMTHTLDEHIERVVRYSWWGAAQAWREGRRAGLNEVLGRSAFRFFRTYVLQLGFLDGMRGLVFCMLQATGTYLKWARLWSWHVNAKRGIAPQLPTFDDDPGTWDGDGSEEIERVTATDPARRA